MKFFSKKIVPVKMPEVIKKNLPASLGGSTGSSANLLKEDAASDPNDEPTWFTSFSLFYYGFFAITCFIYPYVHAADNGLFTNPLAYWTTISPELALVFRLMGAGFLTIVVGPFFDEMFGGPGVTMMAFTRQSCMLSILLFLLFLYYAFYAPIATAIPIIWQAQAAFQGVFVGWAIVEVVSSSASLMEYYTLFLVLEFGFFGLSLASVPSLLFGPGSPFVYWNTWGDFAITVARSQGIGLLGLFVVGYYFFSKYKGFTKMCTVWNIGITILCAIPAFYGGSSANASMWQIQFCMQLPTIIVGLYLELAGVTGPWEISCSCPSLCGMNFETYNLFSLCFQFPFVVAFFYDPNMIFGPSTPTGFPMFKQDLTETGLWFGKGWGLTVLLTVLGPYLFGLPARGVTKQLAFLYLCFVGLFGWSLYAFDFFVLLIVGPVSGVNFILFAIGFYLALQSGDPLYMA